MSSLPLKFVHASDFHLDQPPHAVAEIPAALQDAFVNAAYSAVERVVDAVLAEEAQLLVLSGDILAVNAIGPRSLLFLVQQFERLADRDVPVYWSPGPGDPPDNWPTASMFPENVHRFSNDVGEFVYCRDGQPSVRLVSTSRAPRTTVQASDFQYDDDGLFTIGVAYGQADPTALIQQPIDYWALGGSHQRQTINRRPTIHYPGSPQGRCPAESGPHGCTLVEVEASREIITSPLVCDALRWETEEVAVDPATDIPRLEQKLRDQLQRLVVNSPAQHLLVSWKITGTGPLVGSIGQDRHAADIVAKLRSEFGGQSPAAWTLTLAADPPTSFPSVWYGEESILGEFLRNVQDHQAGSGEPLDIESLLPEGPAADAVAFIADTSNPQLQSALLQRAAALGVQMLRVPEDDALH